MPLDLLGHLRVHAQTRWACKNPFSDFLAPSGRFRVLPGIHFTLSCTIFVNWNFLTLRHFRPLSFRHLVSQSVCRRATTLHPLLLAKISVRRSASRTFREYQTFPDTLLSLQEAEPQRRWSHLSPLAQHGSC